MQYGWAAARRYWKTPGLPAKQPMIRVVSSTFGPFARPRSGLSVGVMVVSYVDDASDVCLCTRFRSVLYDDAGQEGPPLALCEIYDQAEHAKSRPEWRPAPSFPRWVPGMTHITGHDRCRMLLCRRRSTITITFAPDTPAELFVF